MFWLQTVPPAGPWSTSVAPGRGDDPNNVAEAIAETDRQHVPAPTALRGRQKELPDIFEAEQAPKQATVPDQGIERGKKGNGGRRLRRRFQDFDLLADDEALAAHPFHLDRNEVAALDEFPAQRVSPGVVGPPRIRLRGAESAEDVSSATGSEQTVRAVTRQHLVLQLVCVRGFAREDAARQQPLEDVVVAAVAVAAGGGRAPPPRGRPPPRPPRRSPPPPP